METKQGMSSVLNLDGPDGVFYKVFFEFAENCYNNDFVEVIERAYFLADNFLRPNGGKEFKVPSAWLLNLIIFYESNGKYKDVVKNVFGGLAQSIGYYSTVTISTQL